MNGVDEGGINVYFPVLYYKSEYGYNEYWYEGCEISKGFIYKREHQVKVPCYQAPSTVCDIEKNILNGKNIQGFKNYNEAERFINHIKHDADFDGASVIHIMYDNNGCKHKWIEIKL